MATPAPAELPPGVHPLLPAEEEPDTPVWPAGSLEDQAALAEARARGAGNTYDDLACLIGCELRYDRSGAAIRVESARAGETVAKYALRVLTVTLDLGWHGSRDVPIPVLIRNDSIMESAGLIRVRARHSMGKHRDRVRSASLPKGITFAASDEQVAMGLEQRTVRSVIAAHIRDRERIAAERAVVARSAELAPPLLAKMVPEEDCELTTAAGAVVRYRRHVDRFTLDTGYSCVKPEDITFTRLMRNGVAVTAADLGSYGLGIICTASLASSCDRGQDSAMHWEMSDADLQLARTPSLRLARWQAQLDAVNAVADAPLDASLCGLFNGEAAALAVCIEQHNAARERQQARDIRDAQDEAQALRPLVESAGGAVVISFDDGRPPVEYAIRSERIDYMPLRSKTWECEWVRLLTRNGALIEDPAPLVQNPSARESFGCWHLQHSLDADGCAALPHESAAVRRRAAEMIDARSRALDASLPQANAALTADIRAID